MLDNLKTDLEKALNHLKGQLSKIQVGRANPGLIEAINADAYGQSQPIKNIASISIVDNQTLKIEPWDKALIGIIDKAIAGANIGLNPQNMGESILIKIPPLTEDRRRDLSKIALSEGEDAKIAVRNIRQDYHKSITKAKTDKEISEDQHKEYEGNLQDDINKANKDIDELVKNKEADIMKV